MAGGDKSSTIFSSSTRAPSFEIASLQYLSILIMAQPYPIAGVADTGVQPRLELRDLQKNSIQFSLFIQALSKVLDMRNTDSQSPDYLNNPNSWWQIGKHIQCKLDHGSCLPQGQFTDYPISRGGKMPCVYT